MIRFLATIPHSIVFYEAPHRIVRTLTVSAPPLFLPEGVVKCAGEALKAPRDLFVCGTVLKSLCKM